MSIDITMPQLGETVTEGTIVRWVKQVGDQVSEDEVLFEVSTDKVDSEVPSPASGYLTEILVQEGQTVDVGARLAVIGDSAEGAAEPAAEPAPEPESATDPDPAPDPQPEPEASPKPAGARPPEEEPAPEPASAKAARRPEPGGDDGPPAGGRPGQVLSPVVRRLVAEHGIDPGSITGSGAGGRVTRADVLKVIDTRNGGGSAAPTAPAPAPAPAAAPAPATVARAAGDETIAFSNIRRRTAEHMRRSLDTSAHTLVVAEVDYEAVERARLPVRQRFKEEEGVSLSYLPFVARAVVDALADFPRLNASVAEESLIVHRAVNLGIAVDLAHEGLIVPVVRDADDKRLRALAREVADLASRARSKKLGADDISGGTFTITNPGGYGTLLTAPIINQPQVAILSTDGVKPKPVAVALPGGGYGVAVHPVGNLALSFDHRANDGAYASAFLARLREIIETRDWASELT
ncbi:MAG TPA: dihydrolipoamide acetyltransferase family protein [Acidimicrobiales bacterium]|nr:dihydrolipoamide acetyltransferase family protein [Acidimicrobiales bacterium]